jgi:hypothetical protein
MDFLAHSGVMLFWIVTSLHWMALAHAMEGWAVSEAEGECAPLVRLLISAVGHG